MTTVPEQLHETGRENEQEEINLVLDVLPGSVAEALRARNDLEQLLEIVLDLGRLPEARFVSEEIELDERPVTAQDLEKVIELIGEFVK